MDSVDIRTCTRSSKFGAFLNLATSLLYWVVISLLAIAFLNDPPYLTLGLAVLGGLFIGIEVHRAYERHAAVPRPVNDSSFLHWPIIGLVGLNYGWFIFADRPPIAGLALLGVLIILRIVRTRGLFTRTPHDLPIILLVLLTLFSGLVLTVDPSLSLPKVYGVMLSVLAYYEIAYGIRLKENLNRWLIVLNALGIGMAVLGLLGADWVSTKLLNLSKVYAFIPRKIADVPRSIRGGFHPNGVAGTLIFVIPIYAVQLIAALQAGNRRRSWHATLITGLTFLALVSTIVTLVLTQSRGALLGLAVASVALFFAWKQHWVLSLASLVGLLFLVGVLLIRFPTLLGTFDIAQNAGAQKALSSYEFRLTMWRLALQVLQAFPLSGVGIGTLDTVARHLFPYLYPASFLYNPSATITHAHNELLQVAIDLGIPGFVAYVALLAAFVRTAWRVYTWTPDERIKRLILGLGAGMLAHQIFGLTDAFLLGTKPGVVMWMIMGLVTGLYLNLAPDHLVTQGHQHTQPETSIPA
jgi:putative inorganic carbon (HCO3(-)) transporter